MNKVGEICDQLKVLSDLIREKIPNVRLGQILSCIFKDREMFYVSDEDFLTLVTNEIGFIMCQKETKNS